MSVSKAETFLQVVEKSRLVSKDRIEQARRQSDDATGPKDIARKLVKDGAITRWQALQFLAGRCSLELGKYRLLDQLEADDIRRTYLAEHAQLGRRVAIKTLAAKYTADNPQAVKRFLAEASRLASLDQSSSSLAQLA